MEWQSDTSISGAGEAVVTEGSVDKKPSRSGLFAGVALLAVAASLLVFNGADDQSAEVGPTKNELVEAAPVEPPSETVSTAMTLVSAAHTLNQPPDDPNMPDRGAFREAFIADQSASCDYLIDGPEPVATGLYEQHKECLAKALYNLDERCELAAAFFYVMPGDDAVAVACDTSQERSAEFRSTVRQSMVVECDLAREARSAQSHEAYYEYDRCLQQIDPRLDETCYLVARAQYIIQVESTIRAACDIEPDVDLSAVVG